MKTIQIFKLLSGILIFIFITNSFAQTNNGYCNRPKNDVNRRAIKRHTTYANIKNIKKRDYNFVQYYNNLSQTRQNAYNNNNAQNNRNNAEYYQNISNNSNHNTLTQSNSTNHQVSNVETSNSTINNSFIEIEWNNNQIETEESNIKILATIYSKKEIKNVKLKYKIYTDLQQNIGTTEQRENLIVQSITFIKKSAGVYKVTVDIDILNSGIYEIILEAENDFEKSQTNNPLFLTYNFTKE